MKKSIPLLIVALFPFFCFLQMNELNSISHFLNNTNSLYLGTLSSAYIYPNNFKMLGFQDLKIIIDSVI